MSNTAYSDAQAQNDISRNVRQYKDLDLFFSKKQGSKDVNKITDIEAVKRSIRNLVLTNEFDRPFHPEIASHVRDLLFQPFTAITYNLLRNRIDKVLEIYEPRAKLTRIEIDDREFQNMDNNTLSVKIFFTLLNAPTNEENVDIMLERIR